ncbi:MAG: acyltransferase [Candidatus Saccharibacteria bacterium]|nr:acyltransferase [Lachnospiraceae bacterium]MDO4986750.1 acyltransferase [Candidatus Saccharibacteria bacterium]
MSRAKRYFTLAKIFLIRDGYKRADYLRRKKYFKKCGKHCYFQPWNFGTEPFMLSFGENVHVASGVSFVSHDITAMMFRYTDNDQSIKIRRGPISIGNNVFIGSNTTLLYDVKIGNNVIIGAGSLVNKDIPDGSVAAGVPCRVIGSYDEYKKKIKRRI